MTYKHLLLYTLLMGLATAAMLALTYANGTRAAMPGSDVELLLSVPVMVALLLFVVFRPDRYDPTNKDENE